MSYNIQYKTLDNNKSITLSDPEETLTCDMKEQFAVPQLTEEQIQGTWYIVRWAPVLIHHLIVHLNLLSRGLNPVYDCFPCQIFTFGRNASTDSLFVIMDYQVPTQPLMDLFDSGTSTVTAFNMYKLFK